MTSLILLRHGESTWNRENRFTGWTNVDLTEKGEREAKEAGISLFKNQFEIRTVFVSYLKRAIKTSKICLKQLFAEKKEKFHPILTRHWNRH